MKKSIYKITNLINGKIYIGQARIPNERFSEHRRNYKSIEEKYKNVKLYQAMRKYKIENFSFEIIEKDVKNYNEREKYWISYYHSYIGDPQCNGYNMTPGGDAFSLYCKGETHYNSNHTEKEIKELINLIQNTNISFQELAKRFNYKDVSNIRKINIGEAWYQDNLIYPLRKLQNDSSLEQALQIINELQNTQKSQDEIAEQFNVSRSCITMINIGKSFKQDNINYPIRTNHKNLPIKLIIEDLKDNKLTTEEISKKYNTNRTTISNINNGKDKYFIKEEQYPIRKGRVVKKK